MSSTHLDVLRQVLNKHQYQIVEELPGNNFDISGYWKVMNKPDQVGFLLAFEGLDIKKTRPIDQAYGCHLQHMRSHALYFDSTAYDFESSAEAFVSAFETSSATSL